MKRIFMWLMLCLFLFGSVIAQTKLKFSSKFPRKYDSFTVVNGDTILDVFISSNSQTLAAFQQNQGKVKSTFNTVTTGTIPIQNFRSLTSSSYQWITIAPKAQPLLDESQKIVNVNVGRNTSGMTGNGIIVGVVDAGIDAQNDDFKELVGTLKQTRIL
jgi:subtilisin family serine protease